MSKFLTIKQASLEIGLPIDTIRDIVRSGDGKKTAHKFTSGKTAPVYIDMEEFLKVIRSGKVDR